MNIDKHSLAHEIDRAFPFVRMPAPDEIPHHRGGCPTCEQLVIDLDVFRGKAIGADAIRELHQEMSHLSAEAWRWILPHYLRYCLTPEAEYSSFETEFLIYSLSPVEAFEADTVSRLALLSSDQIRVLREFLLYLSSVDYWKNYCPNEIDRGVAFLTSILAGGTETGTGPGSRC